MRITLLHMTIIRQQSWRQKKPCIFYNARCKSSHLNKAAAPAIWASSAGDKGGGNRAKDGLQLSGFTPVFEFSSIFLLIYTHKTLLKTVGLLLLFALLLCTVPDPSGSSSGLTALCTLYKYCSYFHRWERERKAGSQNWCPWTKAQIVKQQRGKIQ